MQKNNLTGSLLLVVTAMIWGLAFTMQEWANDSGIAPFSLLLCRSIVAALFLIPVIMLFDRLRKSGRRLFAVENGKFRVDLRKHEIIGGIISGLFLSAATIFQQIGLLDTGAGLGGFITSLYMVLVPLFSIFFHKKPSLLHWLCVALALSGFALLSISGVSEPSAGYLLVFVAAMLFAGQILVIDFFSDKIDGIRFSLVQFSTCVLVSIPGTIIEKPTLSVVTAALPTVLYLGIASSGIAYTMQILGQQKMDSPTVAGIIMSLENCFALLGAMILAPATNTPTVRQLFGCLIIFAAVILSQLPVGKLFGKSKPQARGDV